MAGLAFGCFLCTIRFCGGCVWTCNKEIRWEGKGNEPFSMSGVHLLGAFYIVCLSVCAGGDGGRALGGCKMQNWRLWPVRRYGFLLAWCEAKTNVPLAGVGFRAVGVDVEARM